MNKKVLVSLITLILFFTACSGGGPQFPFDTGYSDEALDYEEGRLEAEQYPDFDKGAWPYPPHECGDPNTVMQFFSFRWSVFRCEN